MKKLPIFLLMLLVAAFVFANGDSGTPTAAVGPDAVEEAANSYFAAFPEGGYIIKEDIFVQKVNDKESLFVIDIRRAEDYEAGHVTGAVNIPWGPALSDTLTAIPQDGQVYVYCYTGQTAGQAVALMNVAGIPAKSVRYGWVRGISTVDGYEAITDTDGVAIAQMVYEVDPAIADAVDAYYADLGDSPFKNNIVSAADAAAILDAGDDSVEYVSIRKPEDFAAGHIEGAMNVPYGSGMQTGFADLPANKKLIVYCYSGQTAGQTVGILNLLGYDAVSINSGMGTGKTGAKGWTNEGFPVVQ